VACWDSQRGTDLLTIKSANLARPAAETAMAPPGILLTH
jgi:hypothetical protein